MNAFSQRLAVVNMKCTSSEKFHNAHGKAEQIWRWTPSFCVLELIKSPGKKRTHTHTKLFKNTHKIIIMLYTYKDYFDAYYNCYNSIECIAKWNEELLARNITCIRALHKNPFIQNGFEIKIIIDVPTLLSVLSLFILKRCWHGNKQKQNSGRDSNA